MSRVRGAGLALGLGTVVLACSGLGSRTDEQKCAAYADALLAYRTRCDVPLSPTQRDLFVAGAREACTRALGVPGASRLPTAVSVCTQKLRTAECRRAPECEPPTGDLADGAACGDDAQCKSAWCKLPRDPSGAFTSACGTCAARPKLGADCSEGERCADGAVCATSNENATCAAKPRLASEGQACGGSSQDCAAGLYCETTTCVRRKTRGTPCNGSDAYECADGLRCAGGICGTGKTEGQSCTAEECASGLRCNPSTRRCVRVRFVATGEACDDLRLCETGSCTTSGICRDYLAEGAVCGERPDAGTPDGGAPEGGPIDAAAPASDAGAPEGECAPFTECIAGICTKRDPGACR